MQDFGAEQTVDLDLNTFDDLDPAEIEGIEFKLVTENEAPMAAELQLYFQDTSGTVIDSLFAGGPAQAISAAPVGPDGRATGTARAETFIPMDVARFNKIKTADKAFFQAYFTTTDNGSKPVKILADADIRVKMGVRVKKRLE